MPSDQEVTTIDDCGPLALLALALFRPFLRDAGDSVDQRVGLHDSTSALLPRSVYSTRGQVMWRTSAAAAATRRRAADLAARATHRDGPAILRGNGAGL